MAPGDSPGYSRPPKVLFSKSIVEPQSIPTCVLTRCFHDGRAGRVQGRIARPHLEPGTSPSARLSLMRVWFSITIDTTHLTSVYDPVAVGTPQCP